MLVVGGEEENDGLIEDIIICSLMRVLWYF